MANYYAYSRTNYFKVTDEAKLQELVEKIDDAELFEGNNGTFGFGAYNSITSYYDEEEDEDVEIFEELQAILPDGEAVIIKEAGYEKLRYVSGCAFVVTNNQIEVFDLDNHALQMAAEMLGVEKFETVMNY